MTPSLAITLLIVLAVAILLFWLIRSRGNTAGRHIDTSMTAIGAATEAVEDVVDAIVEKVEEVRAEPTPAVASTPAVAPMPAVASTAESAPAAAPLAAVAAPAGGADDLRQLKGVGPKLAARLSELGVTRFDQIAALGPAEIAALDAQLGTFKGRITRDNWVEQAGFLARGDIAGFEAKFGKLDSAGNR